ncbi:MAG TPA: hypothetical protein PKI66_09040, partial [Methanobacteriaceae archaeon]|nr:hypothetical protein [Methanobacteriaceae archaeon]
LGGGTSWNVLNRLFILMTGGTMTPNKRVIGRKGRRCLYHQTPLYQHPITKEWSCPLCEEEEFEEQILQSGYTD